MKYLKLKTNYGSTINTGEFSSKRIDMKATAIFEEGDTFDSVADQLKTDLKNKIELWELEIKTKIFPKESHETEHFNISYVDNIDPHEPFICPECKEIMEKKEGKNYYLCSKHWGYPDMIRQGQVRDKRF